jgi:hypothetical protein
MPPCVFRRNSAGERFYSSVALMGFGERISSYDNHERFSFEALIRMSAGPRKRRSASR